ncbi:hypothetical protein GOV05_05460 [Candidatus Woesearchaeota archaeon]|nr:hypothetical protein [Candidatus Woesearchaeota archaeon]
MVVKRRVSKARYLIAATITLLIFIPGLLLGMIIDNERVRSLEFQSELQELDFKSLQFNYLYLSYIQNSSEQCVPLKVNLEYSIKELGKSLDSIEEYKQESNPKNLELISRKYLLDNLNYWLLSKKTKELCGLDTVSVLYFFNSDCDICPNQGIILTYYKKKLGDRFLVFPINTDMKEDEQMIGLFENIYNITSYPSIVISSTTYKGVVKKEEMRAILCDEYELGINSSDCQELV